MRQLKIVRNSQNLNRVSIPILSRDNKCFASTSWYLAFVPGLAYQASGKIWFHSIKGIAVDLLLLGKDTIRTQFPPLLRSKVGRDFCLRSNTTIPLNEVQIVRLR